MTGLLCDWCDHTFLCAWMAPDDLWLRFAGDHAHQIACPSCFWTWAIRNDILGCFEFTLRQ